MAERHRGDLQDATLDDVIDEAGQPLTGAGDDAADEVVPARPTVASLSARPADAPPLPARTPNQAGTRTGEPPDPALLRRVKAALDRLP